MERQARLREKGGVEGYRLRRSSKGLVSNKMKGKEAGENYLGRNLVIGDYSGFCCPSCKACVKKSII